LTQTWSRPASISSRRAANTSLFGKVDVAFGDETEGLSAKGGMRYNW
jgi:hypothetical protein